MNNVIVIGQMEGEPQIVYTSKDGEKKLYKFTLRTPKPFKNKMGEIIDDFINIKAWSNTVIDEFGLHDQAYLGIEGRIQSFGNSDLSTFANEIIASKIIYLN
ncbi:single-stranded DNA-binding protein [Spiroplasma sabaudiense Ar-1343]|uniref:Single-stranded DNA-binding protein n=1 Tax=Spiroplasma sabaudiense Ar-1343 TaxID=1276257 RepID=W6A9N3_9MOLU|nr:single-stranded DNA-binding protein [Spiroplasma sabaudiense]AHI53686.1 single-stranded DNA-binding protein [Spiroplasma sabaudiense Ar-1343]